MRYAQPKLQKAIYSKGEPSKPIKKTIGSLEEKKRKNKALMEALRK